MVGDLLFLVILNDIFSGNLQTFIYLSTPSVIHMGSCLQPYDMIILVTDDSLAEYEDDDAEM